MKPWYAAKTVRIVPNRSRRRARRLWRYTFGKTAAHKHARSLARLCEELAR